jgi:NitT/TauT family transport system substrate-binding protein
VKSLRNALALVLATGSILASSSALAVDVRMNEVLRSVFYVPQYVAIKIGAFEQEGINLVGPKTTWGTQATVTEVVSGASDIALLGPEAAALTREAAPERRLVNFVKLTDSDGSFIISKTPNANFKIADLKGKTVVTGGAGSTPYTVLIHLIKKAGLDPKKDLTIRSIPVSANILPSFLESGADYAQVFEPAAAKAVSEGKGHRVASVASLLGPVPYTGYAATSNYIEKNPKVIQGFTNAIYKGLLWTDKNSPEKIAEAVAPFFKDVPVQTLAAVIAEYKKAKVWSIDPTLSKEGIDKLVGLLVEGQVLKQSVPYEQIVNPQFAAKAKLEIKQ